MIRIDGAQGEGGGQVLRSSLALSMVTGQPFRITRIRARRKRPGLMRQHLTAVQAACTMCGGTAEGAEIGALELVFRPGPIRAGAYRFQIGTAGSSMLVLQTILPALLMADGPSTIDLEGGTHNPLAPSFHYLRDAFFPALRRMGADCHGTIEQWGFFPAGGGRCRIEVRPPADGLQALVLTERGPLQRVTVLAAVAQIPWDIADDECKQVVKQAEFPVDEALAREVPSIGPGNVLTMAMQFAQAEAAFTGYGEMGVSRKKVAAGVARAANAFFRSQAAVDPHLADQLLLPMALGKGGEYTTPAPTGHTLTNIEVIKTFLDVEILCEQVQNQLWRIQIRPVGAGRRSADKEKTA